MKIAPEVKISDNGFVFNSKTGDSFSLNSAGLELMKMIAEEKEPEEIKQTFISKYDVDDLTSVSYTHLDVYKRQNLCYSNPKVREIITDEIVDYLKNHPWINALHFWLADGSNNNCECDECKKALPSDFYVKMLNELDAKLSAADLSTKIVFLIYVAVSYTHLDVYKRQA